MFEEGWLFLVDKEIIKIIYYSYLNIIQTFFKNSENEKKIVKNSVFKFTKDIE